MPLLAGEGGGGGGGGDFRFGANPSVVFNFVEVNFSATQFRFGFDYTVPALRRALIQRVDVSTRLDATVPPAGTVLVTQDFVPSGGASNALDIMELLAGDGPGTVSLFGLPFGYLLPGDRLVVFLSAAAAASGVFRSAIHGIEYDV